MEIKLSQRLQQVVPSATLAMAAKAKALQKAGKDIINLSAGEPDFDTPDFIKTAATQALKAGFTHYTPSDGIVELKQAVVDKLHKQNQLDYSLDQVIISCGAKQALFNLLQAILNPNDEVIILAPYWVSYPSMIHLAGGKPVIIEADFNQGYKITPEQLDAAITPKTRLVILNSPNNPTGAVYSTEELTELGNVFDQYPHILIASDDIYEYMTWTDDSFSNIVNVCPELHGRCIVINGVSKSYAMTGWRIGYAAGPKRVIQSMKTIQSQSTSNPCSIAQHAALAALTGPQKCIESMLQSYKKRHQKAYQLLSKIKNIQVSPAEGAFYIFPNIQDIIDQKSHMTNDLDFAQALLEKKGVAIVPGSAFGSPGGIRISYATSIENITKGLQRLAEFAGSK